MKQRVFVVQSLLAADMGDVHGAVGVMLVFASYADATRWRDEHAPNAIILSSEVPVA